MRRLYLYKLNFSFEGVKKYTWVEATTTEKAKTIGRILIGNRTGWLPRYKDIVIDECLEYTHKIRWNNCQNNSQ